MSFIYRTAALLVLIVMVAACSHQPNTTKIAGTDSATGKDYQGVSVSSSDRLASIVFLCDAGQELPRILFAHGPLLAKQGKPFGLSYQIDGGELQHHWFVTGSEPNWGEFNASKTMTSVRFGIRPDRNDPIYDRWLKILQEQFITDFMTGKSAAVQVRNDQGRIYKYKFELTELTSMQTLLQDCYDVPAGEDAVVRIARLYSEPVSRELERSRLQRQVSACWNIPALDRSVPPPRARIRAVLDDQGMVKSAEIVDRAKIEDPSAVKFAENALRAVLNPRCQPFRIANPQNRQLILVFGAPEKSSSQVTVD